MSLKVQSLGRIGSAANGITCSDTSNATPIVATLNAGNALKDGDRISLSGITGNTAANGIWTLDIASATTAKLLGSVGNGVHGGAPVVSVVCDKTPFMRGHSALAVVSHQPGAAVPIATIVVEGSDDDVTFGDVVEEAGGLPAFTAGGVGLHQVTLKRYMRMRCSAYTSGGADGRLIA